MRSTARCERALLAAFVVHGLAMVSMALLLVPMLPGGSTSDEATRVALIAAHPWRWRVGWIPWQLSAASDLWLAWALLRTNWIRRVPAVVTLVVTILAVIPDQLAEALYVTRGVVLAREAVLAAAPEVYLRFEREAFWYGSGLAPCLYTLAALGWTWCFATSPAWSRRLGWFSALTWTCFAVASVAPILPASARPPAVFVAGANAVSFLLLEIWLAWQTELVLRIERGETTSGARAPWRSPRRGLLARASDLVANSRLARAVGELCPSIGFRSDITDVVYVNYLVDAARLEPLVPEGLELQRLDGADGEGPRALFTFLTYRHGHFGPTLLGPLRAICPSPVHSNWRIHVVDPVTGKRGIHFVTNTITSLALALGARLMTEGMPMHLLARGEVRRDADGAMHVTLDPGAGSGPDAEMTLRPSVAPKLRPPWSACFADFRALLSYCVPQDRAMSSQPWRGAIVRQEIDLGIPLDACEPLEGEVRSAAARAIVGDAAPICFRVAKVAFSFEGEEIDRRP